MTMAPLVQRRFMTVGDFHAAGVMVGKASKCPDKVGALHSAGS